MAVTESIPSRVCMADIARRVGMSRATVSRGLRNDPRIKASTRRLVQMMAQQMNYLPKASARALAGGRTHTIGVIFADSIGREAFFLAYYAAAIRTINVCLAERNYFLSMAMWSGSQEESEPEEASLPRMLQESAIEAALVLGTPTAPRLEQLLRQQRLPCVMIEAPQSLGRVTVAVNRYRVAEQAVEYLVQLGHRRIVYVPHPKSRESVHYTDPQVSQSPAGYAKGMAVAGLVPNPDWDEHLPGEQYEKFMEELFAAPEPPTALLAFDDVIATSAISWLGVNNIRVPKDVSVISLCPMGVMGDGFVFNIYPTRGVTSHKDMQDQLAKVGIEKLMQLIKSPNEPVESVLLEPELIPRGSTGPCSG